MDTQIAKLPSGDKVVINTDPDIGKIFIYGNAPKNAVHDITISDDVEIIPYNPTSDTEVPSPVPSPVLTGSTEDHVTEKTMFQYTKYLIILLVVAVYIQFNLGFLVRTRKQASILSDLEPTLAMPSIIGFVILGISLMGGMGMPNIPKTLKNSFQNPITKVLALVIITFTGTQDIELSLGITITFLIVMQLIRTNEEREQHPYLI